MTSLADLGEISKGAPRAIKELARSGKAAKTPEMQLLVNEYLKRQALGHEVAPVARKLKYRQKSRDTYQRYMSSPNIATRQNASRQLQTLNREIPELQSQMHTMTSPGAFSRGTVDNVSAGAFRQQPAPAGVSLPAPEPTQRARRWPYYAAATAVPVTLGAGYGAHRYHKRRRNNA